VLYAVFAHFHGGISTMSTALTTIPLTDPGALIRRAWQFNRLLESIS